MLGDQNQLPNVVQGTHPNDVGASVMSFCLGENSVVMPKDGLFLGETRLCIQEFAALFPISFIEENSGRTQSQKHANL